MGEMISAKPAYLAEVGLGCQLDGPVYVDAWEEHDDCTVVGFPVDGVGYLAGARRATLGAMKVHGLLLRSAWAVSWMAPCTLMFGEFGEEHDDCTVGHIPVDGIGYLAGARRETLGTMKFHGLR